MTLNHKSDTGRHTSHSRVRERYWSICKHAVSSEMRPRSVGFGGRFVGRGFVAKGVTFLDFTLKRPLVVHIDEPRPRLMSSTSPFRTDAPRSGLGREFCGRFTLQYGILLHMAVTASCWALPIFLLIRIPTLVKKIDLGWMRSIIIVTITNVMVVFPSV